MANLYNRQILADGPRNAVVNIVGVLDSGDAVLAPAVSISDFTNNDPRFGILNGFRVDCINYSIGDGLQIQLLWGSTMQQLIAAIAGRGKLKYWYAGGLQPNQAALGYDGNIYLNTTGFNTQGIPPQNFTVELAMVKLYKNQ